MADIKELAIAAWRLEKWIDSINVEKKMAGKSALRSIKKYLEEAEITTEDWTGQKFDTGLAVIVINNEDEDCDDEDLIIVEMVRPVILEKGSVIEFGRVIIGSTPRSTIAEEKTIVKNENKFFTFFKQIFKKKNNIIKGDKE